MFVSSAFYLTTWRSQIQTDVSKKNLNRLFYATVEKGPMKLYWLEIYLPERSKYKAA